MTRTYMLDKGYLSVQSNLDLKTTNKTKTMPTQSNSFQDVSWTIDAVKD